MIEVNFKQLREAVVSLNKSGLIPKSIPLVGIEKDKIYEKFMNAMDKIEDDPETGEFPAGAKEALTFFNKMVDLEKKEKEGKVKSEMKEDDNDKKIVKKEKKNSNKIENKDIKTNIAQRPSTMTISNRFGDKIGGIALDFQRKLFSAKYDIDTLTVIQNALFGTTQYFYIEKTEKIDGIVEHINEITRQLNEHPNEIAILGFTIRMLRQYDCYYRYKTGEKTKAMFETQEVYYKLLFDSVNQSDVLKKGIELLKQSRLREDDDKKSVLAVLVTIRQLIKEYNLDSFEIRLKEIILKHNINDLEFEKWYNSIEFNDLLKQSKSRHFYEQIKFVRDNKKLHFWFNSGTIKLATIHSFKGWEANTLFLVIEERYDSGDFRTAFSELIYTGLTRTKSNLIVLNYGNKEYDNDLNEIFKFRK